MHFILFQGRVGLVKNGLTNYYRFLDAGVRDKEAKSTAVVEKHKNNKQNLDMPPAEYRLPLVWIDLEMTGKIVFGSLQKIAYCLSAYYLSPKCSTSPSSIIEWNLIIQRKKVL